MNVERLVAVFIRERKTPLSKGFTTGLGGYTSVICLWTQYP